MIALHILKIVGIVVACILCLIILIICLVLFAPMSYKMIIRGKNEEMALSAHIRWLLGLIDINVTLDRGGLNNHINLAGVTLKKKENSLFSRIAKKILTSLIDFIKKDFFGMDPMRETKAAVCDENIGDDRAAEKKSAIIGKITDLIERIKKNWNRLKTIKYVLGAPVTKRAWDYLKEQIIGFFEHIKPKKTYGKLVLGTGEPDTTAYLYAMASFASEAACIDLNVIPDMENKEISADMTLKGRLVISFLLAFLWRLLVNKDIRRVAGYIGRNL